MGPSGVRLTQPKDIGTILMDVDQEGLNAALGFAMHLESTHKLYIHTDAECVPILKRHLKNTSVNVDPTVIPKRSYTHVWVLAKPEETKPFSKVPLMKPLPIVDISSANCVIMRDWASVYGAAVRQWTMCQETTMAKHGTHPEYKYQ